jgi:hypothetical protein
MASNQQHGAGPKTGPAIAEGETRIAPDPMAVVLPVLAALGAVASIAAVHWGAEERPYGRARSRRRLDVTLRDLESCCLGLTEITRRLATHPRLFAGHGAAQSSPLKFGVHGPRVDASDARLFHALVNDVASMLVLATQNAFDVMSAIEDGEIEPPEGFFFALGAEQDRLNRLIQDRAPMRDLVAGGQAAAGELTRQIRALRALPRPERR